jgi:hypothetical protein
VTRALTALLLFGSCWLLWVAWGRVRRRAAVRTWTDPHADPGATASDPEAWAVDHPLSVERVRVLLDTADRERPYRAPLRAIPVPSLVNGGAPGLAAEVLARLGHLDRALALAEQLPPDDPAACWVRHVQYRVTGDAERTEAALVAAVTLAGPEDRARYARTLARWRLEHPRYRSVAERLWDP